MIAGVIRHGRTQRESRALTDHLLKAENEPRVRILGGTLAVDLPGAIRDMERLRNSTSAEAAALHIHLSPSRSMSDEELLRAAEIVRHHLGAVDHPAALVVHDKERNEGEGHSHAHLVLGRVGPSGQVLESGFEKIKLETAARIIEFELGEPATLGRHHRSAVKWLQANGRRDVAAWLDSAHGQDPDRPQSSVSPDSRQALARQGIDLSVVRTEIRDAWRAGGAEAVRGAGFDIEPGRKSGIYVVSRDGVEIGSLDRLTKEKRAAVRSAMKIDRERKSGKTGGIEESRRSGKPIERVSKGAVGDRTPENPARFRSARLSTHGRQPPLLGKKTALDEIAEASRKWAAAIAARIDDALTIAHARHWIKLRQNELKAQILSADRDGVGSVRGVGRMRHELAVLDAATVVLAEDPGLAFGGEAVLMGAARRHHAEQRLDNREIRTGTKVANDGNAAQIPPGRQSNRKPASTLSSPSVVEKSRNSRTGSKSVGAKPSGKPVQRDSQGVMGDPSSEKNHLGRSAEKAARSAWSFLGRREAELRGRIGELSRPERLADPDELIDASHKLSDAARELADWDAHHSVSVVEFRGLTDRPRPMGFIAWMTGATARYDAASRELAALFDRREPLLKAASMARRSVRILNVVQETRQARHDAARCRERDSLKRQLELIGEARSALEADPTIALGGGKALADAARRLRAERQAMERHRNLKQGQAALVSRPRM